MLFALTISGWQVIGQSWTTARRFLLDNHTYTISYYDDHTTIYDESGDPFAEVSEIIVNPLDQSLFLTVNFKTAVREALGDRLSGFTFTHANGETVDYTIVRVNNTFNIRRETPTELIRIFEHPSTEHLLGTTTTA